MPYYSCARAVLSALSSFLKKALVAAIRCYRRYISILLPPSCRYYPSCSHYLEEAVGSYGFFLGCCKGVVRVLRCNYFFNGGYDPIKSYVTKQKV
ncbi:MAG: membrane protein insertion efficiency factor YidD [Omnitrophica WOR_2 bacterium GWF2_43_52]|nr:MAG: membrane protein insertion efficiency factor YidD [Omnitrophica WOR_2 bacterium GWA2_44_7]OGX18061.1 MAG: membrane protein insertion efficiency factor YidD [Omnitrophica WOR_2 bacterium GWC2_44_8]OGX20493.1 MAG: membrane protein insertion efficiency factor YidD [Omnitrophica WOR_2 bacterium GWF2_43_52]HAH20548.1 membrane protein insertion efficiency factor YidD [Candidatus Omnitrophota bacterium]HBG62811.1 membrane protein insertion efficiency factor YidD [Candidatus Omnitrophota bacter